jgi:hypothetical protein
MLEQRLTEYETIDDAKLVYKDQTGLTDAEINRMDADVYAAEVMSIANVLINQRKIEAEAKGKQQQTLKMVENKDIQQALKEEDAKHAEGRKLRYANGKLSREDIQKSGMSYMDKFYEAFIETRDDWKKNPQVQYFDDCVKTKDGRVLIDFNNQELKDYSQRFVDASQEEGKRVYAEGTPDTKAIEIRPEFIKWLCELDSWPTAFDNAVARLLD